MQKIICVAVLSNINIISRKCYLADSALIEDKKSKLNSSSFNEVLLLECSLEKFCCNILVFGSPDFI